MYILPTEQSVPTVSRRLPARGLPLPIGNVGPRVAHIVELAAEPRRGIDQPRFGVQPVVQPRCDIEPGFHRGQRIDDQCLAQLAARIGDAEHQSPRSRGARRGEIHPRQVERQRAIVVAIFADADVGPEHGEPARGLDVGGVTGMAEVKKIGCVDHGSGNLRDDEGTQLYLHPSQCPNILRLISYSLML